MLPVLSPVLVLLSVAVAVGPLRVMLVTLNVAGTWFWLTVTVSDAVPQVMVYWAEESRSVSGLLVPS